RANLDHLSQQQVEAYGLQGTSPSELILISEHLGVCEACRQQLSRSRLRDEAFFNVRSEIFPDAEGLHLSAELLGEYVDKGIEGEELQSVTDHLNCCTQCSLAVEDLRSFKAKIAPVVNREYRPVSTIVSASGSRTGKPFFSGARLRFA